MESNLMPGESVVYATRLHWFTLVAPVATCVCGLLVMVFSGVGSGPRWPYVGILGAIALLLGAVVAMTRFVAIRSSELAVTSRRVMFRVGFVRRRAQELILQQVETIAVDQGVIGRMFGYGRVTIVGTKGTREPISHVADPIEFRRQVLLELVRV